MSAPSRLAALRVTLPLRLDENEPGVVLDAAGHEVFVVDVNNDRLDAEVEAIAEVIVAAVNSAGDAEGEQPW